MTPTRTRLAEVPAVAAAILRELEESGQFDAAHRRRLGA
jgi:3-hydroxybutyryl-CoA dehydrogenase